MAIKRVHLGKAKEVCFVQLAFLCLQNHIHSHCQGINMTALREIKILRELHDPHVVQLLDVFAHKNNIHLVRILVDVAHRWA